LDIVKPTMRTDPRPEPLAFGHAAEDLPADRRVNFLYMGSFDAFEK